MGLQLRIDDSTLERNSLHVASLLAGEVLHSEICYPGSRTAFMHLNGPLPEREHLYKSPVMELNTNTLWVDWSISYCQGPLLPPGILAGDLLSGGIDCARATEDQARSAARIAMPRFILTSWLPSTLENSNP